MKPSSLLVLAAGGALGAIACSADVPTPDTRHFDRPVDMAFGCVGNAKLDDGGLGPLEAIPLGECDPKFDSTGDAGPLEAVPLGFAVQEVKGDVVIAHLLQRDVGDSDPLTPGFNGLAVGGRPVSADTLPDGCHVVVANAGSCDLSLVDVLKASSALVAGGFEGHAASRLAVLGAGGKPLAASPAQVTTLPPAAARSTCGDPAGVAYLAYPSCHAIAAVDVATGQIVSTVTFPEAGPPMVGDGQLACPVECSGIADPAGAAETPGRAPISMAVAADGGRMYVGARDASVLYLVDLDAEGRFTAVSEVALENALGVRRVAVTPDLEMGQGGQSGTWRFVYAVAADASIRVVDVTTGHTPVECDTQVDPRLTRTVTDLQLLPCFPVGGLSTPRRRPGARGPGVRLTGDATPFDVAFVRGNELIDAQMGGQPLPDIMNGLFAVVPSRNNANGSVVFYINVDDDNYEDIEDPDEPLKVDMTLALPHQLRDGVQSRRAGQSTDCRDDLASEQIALGPVRLFGDPRVQSGVYNFNHFVDREDYVENTEVPGRLFPMMRQELCDPAETGDPPPADPGIEDDVSVFQLSSHAPVAVRERAFPDLLGARVEQWTVAWEGPLGVTAFEQLRAGGLLEPAPPGGPLELTLTDTSAPFCDLGAEERDIVRLSGCSNEADCGLDEECFVHPDAPAGLPGLCLARNRLDELAATCRPLLVSARRYLIKNDADAVHADRLILVPKPTTLASSPVDGCSDVAQCKALHDDELDQIEAITGVPQPRDQQWMCHADSALGGPPRCIATCPGNSDDECPGGSVCQDLVCVDGAYAPAECYGALQIFEVRAGGAFTVVGTVTGYLHNRLLDLGTGRCVTDPLGDRLRVGRFRPIEPACDAGDAFDSTGPNPCSTQLSEAVAVRETDGTFSPGFRTVRGIRFENTSFRVDFSDVVSVHPTLGTLQAAFPLGLNFTFTVGAGFLALADGLFGAAVPARVRSAPDGSAWVVDSGDQASQFGGETRGKLIHVSTQRGADSTID